MKKLLLLLMVVLVATLPGWAAKEPAPVDGEDGKYYYLFSLSPSQIKNDGEFHNLQIDNTDTNVMMKLEGSWTISSYGVQADAGCNFILTVPSPYIVTGVQNGSMISNLADTPNITGLNTNEITYTGTSTLYFKSLKIFVEKDLNSAVKELKIAFDNIEGAPYQYTDNGEPFPILWNEDVALPKVTVTDVVSGDVVEDAVITYTLTGNIEKTGSDQYTGIYPVTTADWTDTSSDDSKDWVKYLTSRGSFITVTASADGYEKTAEIKTEIRVNVEENETVTITWSEDDEETWTVKYGEPFTIPAVKATASGRDVTGMGNVTYRGDDSYFLVNDGQINPIEFKNGEGTLRVTWDPKTAWENPLYNEYPDSFNETQNFSKIFTTATLTHGVTVESVKADLEVKKTDFPDWQPDGDLYYTDVNITEGYENMPLEVPSFSYGYYRLTAPSNGALTFSLVDGSGEEYEEDDAPVSFNYDAENNTLTISANEGFADEECFLDATFTPSGEYANMFNPIKIEYVIVVDEKTAALDPVVTFTPDLYGDGAVAGSDVNASLFINSVNVTIEQKEKGGTTWYTLDGLVPEKDDANSYQVEFEEGSSTATLTFAYDEYAEKFIDAYFPGAGETPANLTKKLALKVVSIGSDGKVSEVQTYEAYFVAPYAFADADGEAAESDATITFADPYNANLSVINPAAFSGRVTTPSLSYTMVAEGEDAENAEVQTSYYRSIDLSNKGAGKYTITAWYSRTSYGMDEESATVNGVKKISQIVNIAYPTAVTPIIKVNGSETENAETVEIASGAKVTFSYPEDFNNGYYYTIKYTLDGTDPTAENGETIDTWSSVTLTYNATAQYKNLLTVKAVAYPNLYPAAISDVVKTAPLKITNTETTGTITFKETQYDWNEAKAIDITAENFIDYVICNPEGLVSEAKALYYSGLTSPNANDTYLYVDGDANGGNEFTFKMKEPVIATSIIVNAKETNSTIATTLKVNGEEMEMEGELYKDYVFEVPSRNVSELTFGALSSPLEIKSIRFELKGSEVGEPTITVNAEEKTVTIETGANGTETYYAMFENVATDADFADSSKWKKYEAPFAPTSLGYIYAYSSNDDGDQSEYAIADFQVQLEEFNGYLRMDAGYYDMSNASVNKVPANEPFTVAVYTMNDSNADMTNVDLNTPVISVTDVNNVILTENVDFTFEEANVNGNAYDVTIYIPGQYKVTLKWQSDIEYNGGSLETAAWVNVYAPVVNGTDVEVVNGSNFVTVTGADATISMPQAEGVELYYAIMESAAPQTIRAFAAANSKLTFEEVNNNPAMADMSQWTLAENGDIQLTGEKGAFMTMTKQNNILSPTNLYYYGSAADKDGDFTTGIFGVNAVEEGAEYYDLNGYRVSGNELKAGIYVKVLNGNATKVVVK